MRSDLRVTLTGKFRLTHRGSVVPLESSRLQALLAYLILHSDAPQPRQHVAFIFWPDSTEEQARTNLRQLVHQLRRLTPGVEKVLSATRRTLQWRGEAAECDIAELEKEWRAAELAEASGDVPGAIDALWRAMEHWGGNLLPSCYEAWIEAPREGLRRKQESALSRLTELLESRRRFREAATAAERLLELDPLREETHRACIRLHGLAGEPGLAAAALQRCQSVLAREVGVEPSPRTQELAQRIIRAGWEAPAGEVRALDIWPTPSSEAADPAARTVPFVGRHGEWARLLETWTGCGEGTRRVALIAGEAGMGKTRLAEEFTATLARQGVVSASARCYAAEGLLPFGPAAQWLRSEPLLGNMARLEEPWSRELGRLLPELRTKEGSDTPSTGESGRRLRLFEALARGILASGASTILLLDDIQWCDADTLEWLHYLLRFDYAPPLLLVATARLEELDPGAPVDAWLLQLEASAQLERLTLGPLSKAETRDLAAGIASFELNDEASSRLFRETEGNPLFVVEFVRAWRSAAGPDSQDAPQMPSPDPTSTIPARVQAVLRHRLGQLSPAGRSLVAYAATVGRDVPLELLHSVVGNGMEMIGALDELCRRFVLNEREGLLYSFSHDRIREVAYQDLSSARRALLHYQIAGALESLHGEDPDVAGEIARHLDRADRVEEAIPHYRRAADRALSLFSSEEAARHLKRALSLVERLRDRREKVELELELQTALGVPLVARYHYSDPRVWRAYERAHQLAADLDRAPGPPVLRALALANLMRSRLPEVVDLGRALLEAARSSRDPILQVEAHYVLGVSRFWQGRISSARRHLHRALARYDPQRAAEHLRLYAQDPGIICGVRLALAEWVAGAVGAARVRLLVSLEQAEGLQHPFSLAYARYFGSFILLECGDHSRARHEIGALLRDSEEHRLANWPTTGAIFAGWLRFDAGDPSGLDSMRTAMDAYSAGGFSLGSPYHHGLLARALHRAGRSAEALDTVDEAIGFGERTGERFWESELLRMRGDLARRLGGDRADATAAYRQALEVARRQGAGALVARARASLIDIGEAAPVPPRVHS
jgi:DNA-binding SARP family transcriptional activator/predicted ATPase